MASRLAWLVSVLAACGAAKLPGHPSHASQPRLPRRLPAYGDRLSAFRRLPQPLPPLAPPGLQAGIPLLIRVPHGVTPPENLTTPAFIKLPEGSEPAADFSARFGGLPVVSPSGVVYGTPPPFLVQPAAHLPGALQFPAGQPQVGGTRQQSLTPATHSKPSQPQQQGHTAQTTTSGQRQSKRPSHLDYFIPPSSQARGVASGDNGIAIGGTLLSPPQVEFAPAASQTRALPPPASAGSAQVPLNDQYLPPPIEYLPPPQKPAPSLTEEYLPPPKAPAPSLPPEHSAYLPPPSDSIQLPTLEYLPPPKQPVTTPTPEYLPPPKEPVSPSSEYLPPPQEPVSPPTSDYLPPPQESVSPPTSDYLPPPKEPLTPPTSDYLPPPKEPIGPPTSEYLPPPPEPVPQLDLEYLPPQDQPVPQLELEYLPPDNQPAPQLDSGYLPPPKEPVGPPTSEYLPPPEKPKEEYLPPTGGRFAARASTVYSRTVPSKKQRKFKLVDGVLQRTEASSGPDLGRANQDDPCASLRCPGSDRCQVVLACGKGRSCSSARRVAECVSRSHPTCHHCRHDEVCVLRKLCAYSESCPGAMQCMAREHRV